MWRVALAALSMLAIILLLIRLEQRPQPARLTPAQQEAEWARQRASAPFQLRLRRIDGTQPHFATGGRGWVVIQPDRVEDFGLAVGSDLPAYAPRREHPGPNWHIAIEARAARDSGFPLGEAVPWPGGALRRVRPADVQQMHMMGPLEPGQLLAYAPDEQLLVDCLAFGSCRMIFQVGRFQVRMVFHERDRAHIRTIAADLRRCLPQWDGRVVEIVAPQPGCQPA